MSESKSRAAYADYCDTEGNHDEESRPRYWMNIHSGLVVDAIEKPGSNWVGIELCGRIDLNKGGFNVR